MNVTFEQLQKANATIITTDIKGKEYAEVNQRIKAFRFVYPSGTIETEMLNNDNGVCTFRAKVSNDGLILGTGTAQEKESSSFINKTSYIENCETSAVGRALGMAGFGIDTSIASYEEVANAIQQQKQPLMTAEKIGDAKVEELKKRLDLMAQLTEQDVARIMKFNNFTKQEQITSSIIEEYNKQKTESKKGKK